MTGDELDEREPALDEMHRQIEEIVRVVRSVEAVVCQNADDDAAVRREMLSVLGVIGGLERRLKRIERMVRHE